MHLLKAEVVSFVILSVGPSVVVDLVHINIAFDLTRLLIILKFGILWVFLFYHVKVDDFFLYASLTTGSFIYQVITVLNKRLSVNRGRVDAMLLFR